MGVNCEWGDNAVDPSFASVFLSTVVAGLSFLFFRGGSRVDRFLSLVLFFFFLMFFLDR